MLQIEEFAKRVENANTRWLISWELESNLSVRAAQMWEAHYRTLVALGLLRNFALVANPHSPKHFGGARRSTPRVTRAEKRPLEPSSSTVRTSIRC